MDAKATSIATFITGSIIMAVAGYVIYCYYPYGSNTSRQVEAPAEETKDKKQDNHDRTKREENKSKQKATP